MSLTTIYLLSGGFWLAIFYFLVSRGGLWLSIAGLVAVTIWEIQASSSFEASASHMMQTLIVVGASILGTVLGLNRNKSEDENRKRIEQLHQLSAAEASDEPKNQNGTASVYDTQLDNVSARLDRLNELHKSGLITETEYIEGRRKIVSEL